MASTEHLKILNNGVEAWNHWREKNPNVIPDISGASFGNENFASIDFSKADLHDCNFQSKNLPKANFNKANIRGCDFSNSSLEGADFSEAQAGQTSKQLTILVSIGCGFGLIGAGLAGLTSPFNLIVAAVGFTVGEFGFAAVLSQYKVFDYEAIRKLNGTSFAGSHLDQAKFVKAELYNCDFSRASIIQVDWKDAQFKENCFFPNDFNWEQIRLLCITRKGDNISFKNFNLSNLELTNANFRDSNLQKCNLNSTILTNANFRDSNLQKCNLNSAILRDANLCHVDFSGSSANDTDFSGADITGSCLKNLTINSDTKFKDIKCEYFYLDQDKKERIPTSDNLKIGEFEQMANILKKQNFSKITQKEAEKILIQIISNINTSGGNYNERIQGNYIQANYYAAGQPQNLAQAAAEIQLLLKQLEQSYPSTTTSQQMVVAAEAINRIESNPLLKERVINAVKSGGLAAFEKAIDKPAGAFIVGAIKGWQEVETED